MAWGKVVSHPIKSGVRHCVKEVTGNPTVAAIAGAATGAIVSHIVHDHVSAATEHVELIATITDGVNEIDLDVKV